MIEPPAQVALVVGWRPLGRLLVEDEELGELLGDLADAVGEAAAVGPNGRRRRRLLRVMVVGLRGREAAPYARHQFALLESFFFFF